MADVPRCLTVAELQALIDGSLPQERQAAAETHLESCDGCRQALEAQAGHANGIPLEVAGAASATRSMALEDAMRKLKSDTDDPAETVATDTHAPSWLPTLSPSDDPRSLGRLGSYEILEVIGRGGMGTVFKARDQRLDRLVAVKVLNPDLAASGPARQRFLQEARSAAAVTHDHVVTIHAVDEAGGAPFLVMEYILGVSLADRIQRSGHLRVEEILRIGMQAASGLAAAHAQGIVHRDIKPANILLENGVERVKLSDFGLARVIHEAQLTNSGAVAGTPEYMSPEQACGEPVDHRSDLFSLGCVMYAMSVGRSPFRADTAQGAMHRVREHSPRPIQETNPDTPDWLAAIINRLLEKKPEDRYQSAEELAEVLEGYLAHVQQPSRVALPRFRNRTVMTWNGGRSRWTKAGASVASLLVIAVVTAFAYWWTGTPDTAPHAETPTTIAGRERAIEPPPEPQPPDSGRLTMDFSGSGLWMSLSGPGLARTFTETFQDDLVLEPGRYTIEIRKGPGLGGGYLAIPSGKTRRVEITDDWLLYPPLGSQWPDEQELVQCPANHSCVTFSPLSDVMATSSGETITLWKLEDNRWKKSHTLEGHSQDVRSLVFSPDGTLLASVGQNEDVRLWNPTNGQHIYTFGAEDKSSTPQTIAFTREAPTLLIAYSDGEIAIWHCSTYQELHRWETHANPAVSVAYSLEGALLATGHSQGAVKLWDMRTRKLQHTLVGHTGSVEQLAFLADGRTLLSCSVDSTVKSWDAPSGQLVASYGHRDAVLSIALSPDEKTLAAVGVHQAVKLWNVNGQNLEARAEFHAHWSDIQAVALSQDGSTMATASNDHSVKIWDVKKLQAIAKANPQPQPQPHPMYTFPRMTGWVTCVEFSPNGDLLGRANGRGRVQVWKVSELHKILDIETARGMWLNSLAFAPDGREIVTCNSTTEHVQIHRIDPDSSPRLISVAANPCGLVISPDGTTILTRHFTELSLMAWSSSPNGPVTKFQSIHGRPTAMAISPDGNTVAMGTSMGYFSLWNLSTGSLTFGPQQQKNSFLECMEFSSDGRILGLGSHDGTVVLWDVKQERVHNVLAGHPGLVYSMSFCPNAEKLIVASGTSNRQRDTTSITSRLTLWKLAANRFTCFDGHPGNTWRSVFSPDGQMIATAGRDGKTHLWDVQELTEHASRKYRDAGDASEHISHSSEDY
jgi:eukaryotic-like serine/threonine-protein kinase